MYSNIYIYIYTLYIYSIYTICKYSIYSTLYTIPYTVYIYQGIYIYYIYSTLLFILYFSYSPLEAARKKFESFRSGSSLLLVYQTHAPIYDIYFFIIKRSHYETESLTFLDVFFCNQEIR